MDVGGISVDGGFPYCFVNDLFIDQDRSERTFFCRSPEYYAVWQQIPDALSINQFFGKAAEIYGKPDDGVLSPFDRLFEELGVRWENQRGWLSLHRASFVSDLLKRLREFSAVETTKPLPTSRTLSVKRRREA
ncbi:MAG: hypothetical protein QG604_338 [Candidatus Dependentiae bacterium]|nr:hypothetical protein [Candidatus Dependentiae bacterium]